MAMSQLPSVAAVYDHCSPSTRNQPKRQINIKSEHDAILLHILFTITATVALITSPQEDLGLRIWSLIIGWYTSVLFIALQRNHTHWLEILNFLILLCGCFIFPDGFLTQGLKTISFPDMNVGQIYGVTSFMPLMWAIPLFISKLVGYGMKDRGYDMHQSALGAGLMGLILMGGSEVILTRIPIWHALDNSCTSIIGGHVAIYVLFPEFCLGGCTFLGLEYIGSQQEGVPLIGRFAAAFMIMCMYLGNLIVCFMIVDGEKF
mmetsp:Transcript_8710/g.16218  ORF Transcript_8710/g.16218 Transcript_8710/m.16218 type:complete len:261 (+) Transcript_8710:195-977(+)